MKNPIHSGDPREWDGLTLPQQLEHIRRDLCAGPCGASMSVMTWRGRVAKALRQAILAAGDFVPRDVADQLVDSVKELRSMHHDSPERLCQKIAHADIALDAYRKATP